MIKPSWVSLPAIGMSPNSTPPTVSVSGSLTRWSGAYNPVTGTWRPVSPNMFGLLGSVRVWTGRQVLVWGGLTGTFQDQKIPPHGVAYDPAANWWSAMPTAPLRGRSEPTAVWTGRQMIVWGGTIPGTQKDTPATDGALLSRGPLTRSAMPEGGVLRGFALDLPAGCVYRWRSADRISPASLGIVGAASKAGRARNAGSIPGWVANHAGAGRVRNGALMTVFSGSGSMRVLPMTPRPDWMSVSGWPG